MASFDSKVVAVPGGDLEVTEHQDRGPAVVDAANDAFVTTDATGAIAEWNTQAERLFGWPRAEVIGRDLVDTLFGEPAHRDGSDRFESLLLRTPDPVTAERLELSMLHRDGRVIAVECITWTTDGADGRRLHAFMRDLSGPRQADEERLRLAAIIESSDEAIVGSGVDLRILTWNRGAERLYGYSAAEAVGQPLAGLVPSDGVDELTQLVDRARRGMPVHQHETRGVRSNGVVIDVALTISPARDRDGELTGFSVIARDITEQRWMAETLRATLQSLEVALAEARESEARCRRFTADAAHQLRTPIAGIRACAETLLRDPSPVARDTLLADVVRETARAGRLMTGLLQLARLDQGEVLVPVKCDVVRLCSDEVERARILAPNLEFEVVVDQVPDAPPELDGHAVREILTNLLDNARRHAANRVELVVTTDGEQVELKVVDDGKGVPPGMEGRIFERFVSSDGKGGSGLGLPIAQGLARTHRGDLTYEQGAFVLRLPVKSGRDCGGAGDPNFAPVDRSADDWGPWLSA